MTIEKFNYWAGNIAAVFVGTGIIVTFVDGWLGFVLACVWSIGVGVAWALWVPRPGGDGR